MTNTLPPGSSPDLDLTLQDLTDQYFYKSPDSNIKGNRVAAANAAIKQLIAEQYIKPDQDRGVGLYPGSTSSGSINKGVLQDDGSVSQVPHFRVDIMDPKTGQPYPRGKAPKVRMQSLSNDVAKSTATATTATTPPAGALGPAPPGAADGTTGTTSTGQRGVVRGGWVFPAPGG
jgi:hypothetical protein